jgi:hypothetical protein
LPERRRKATGIDSDIPQDAVALELLRRVDEPVAGTMVHSKSSAEHGLENPREWMVKQDGEFESSVVMVGTNKGD